MEEIFSELWAADTAVQLETRGRLQQQLLLGQTTMTQKMLPAASPSTVDQLSADAVAAKLHSRARPPS